MRSSDRTETFPARAGFLARISGRDASDGFGLRHACARGSIRGGGCQRNRFPGSFGRALEGFGVDRIVFDTLESMDPHGVRR